MIFRRAASIGVIFLLSVFGGVLLSEYTSIPKRVIGYVSYSFKSVFADVGSSVKGKPENFLQFRRYPGYGVTLNEAQSSDELIMLAGFFDGAPSLKLIERDGTQVAKWDASYSRLFPDGGGIAPPKSDWHVDVHGAVLEPDGSAIFNLEYRGTFKKDKCDKLLWANDKPLGHHSVEVDEFGHIWVPGRIKWQPPYAQKLSSITDMGISPKRILEDTIVEFDPDGNVVREISVLELFEKNGLVALLSANGQLIDPDFSLDDGGELFHLNKVAVLSSEMATAFKDFDAGDLLLSFRTHNLVLVADPETLQVKWMQIGPWLRQHNPIFHGDGTISVFNNNAFLVELDGVKLPMDSTIKSNIVRYDFTMNKDKVAYGALPDQHFATVVRGRHEASPNGGYIISEFEGGRVFEVDENGALVWEYVNGFDEDNVAEITGAAIYPRHYFTDVDWACN